MKSKTILSLIILSVALVGAVTIVWGSNAPAMNFTGLTVMPRRPILNFPAANATSSYTGSTFQMTATDQAGNYLQYKQEIYYNEACTQVVQSNSQTSTQTGWSGQNASSVPYKAYTAGNATGTTGSFTLQSNLATGTTYYWGAQAYDPDGAVAWGTSTLTRVDNSWTDTQALPGGRYNYPAVAYNGYVYVNGGQDVDGNATSSVLYAQVQSNGSLGSWTNTQSLPTSTAYHSSVAWKGYVYVIGGSYTSNWNDTSTVRYAQIQSNGSLGSWTNTQALPKTTSWHSSVVYNGYVYVIGGYGNSLVTSTVRYALLNATGSISNWSSTTALPSSTYGQSSVAYNGYVYAIGGHDKATRPTSTVLYAQINATGSLGSWTNAQSLPTSTYNHSSVVYNGYVYVIGGEWGFSTWGPTSTVLYSSINATGSLGSWTNTQSLPTSTYYHSSVVSNGYVYVIGGEDTNGATTTVRYTQINVQGTTADEGWLAQGSVSSSIYLNRAISSGGYLYSLGGTSDGTNGTTTVNYALLNSNGTLANWGTTTALSANTVQHGAFVYNGTMYAVGGSSTVSVAGNGVRQSTIGSNGTLGTWSTSVSAQLPTNYNNSFVGANNGYAYLVGGDDATVATSAVLYGPISSTGTITNWSSTSPLPNIITKQGGIILNNVIYSIGGSTDVAVSNPTTTVNYAPINANGSVATWTFSTNLPAPLIQPNVEAYNNFIYVMGGSSTAAYGGATSTVLYAVPWGNPSSSGFVLQSSGTLSSWLAATPLPSPLYQEGSAVVNGYLYTVGGSNSSGATTTVQNTGLYVSCVPFTAIQSNNVPSVSSVVLNHGSTTITLTPNATTSFDINYTVTDQDGCADIVSMTSTAFRLGVSPTCAVPNPTTNNLNCYSFQTHTTSSCISSTQYNVTDTVDIYYFAQSTGDSSSTYPSDQWEAYATARDNSGATGSATSSARNVGIMTAINLSTSTINYGTLYTNTNTSSTNQLAGAINVGNSSTTLSISGTAFVSGGNSIATSTQHYATTTFTYGSTIDTALSSTAATVPGFSTIAPHIDTSPTQNWNRTQAMPGLGLYRHASVVYNGYIYTTGGYFSNATNTVFYAPINSTGSISTWYLAPNRLPTSTSDHAAVAYNGYVYVLGGADKTGANLTSTVSYSQINTSSTGQWNINPNSLPTALRSHGAVVNNGYIYVTGGYGNGAVTSTVLYAQINTSSTGAWYVNPNALPSVIEMHGMVVYNNYIYVIGGFTGSEVTSTVLYAQINTSSTGQWNINPNSLPSPLYRHSAIAYNGYIYVIGGESNAVPTSTILYAQINTSSTGPWYKSSNSLINAIEQSSAVTYNGYIYLLGGLGTGSVATTTVSYTSLDNRPIYWGTALPLGTPPGAYQSTVTYLANWAP